MNYIVLSLLLTFAIGNSLGNLQYFTVYDDKEQQGTSFTLEDHVSDLTDPEFSQHFYNASSYCALGWWVAYTNKDFNIEGGVGILLDQTDDAPRCEDRVFTNFKSIRYLGNKDSNVPHISFYSKASYHGLEMAFNYSSERLSANIGFAPLSFVTTGWSNWTFHQGLDGQGESWCVDSADKVVLVAEIVESWPTVQSVTPGCGASSGN